MFPFQLRYTPGRTYVLLRELKSGDELAVNAPDTANALRLLDCLIFYEEGNGHSAFTAREIVTADRDRLMAYLYASLYGVKIRSTVTCQACETPYDMDFSLKDLQSHLEASSHPSASRGEDGSYHLESGCRFRLPTGEDELAIIGHPAEEAAELLLKRCILEGDPATEGEQVQQAMAQLAPVIQTEIQASCPECGEDQELRFDIQSFFLSRLRNESDQTAWEIHRLASVYHWGYQDLLELPRSLRRRYLSFIEAER